MDLQRIRILLAIEREGSISGAARSLGYTAAAVSQQLAKLEKEIGVPLVRRHARGVKFTEAGRAAAEAGRDIEHRIVRLASQVEGISGKYSAKFKVATFQSAAAGFLPHALSQLIQQYPDLSVEFVQVARSEALKALRQNIVDAAFFHSSEETGQWMNEPELRIQLLFHDPMMLVVANHSEMSSWQEPVDLRSLEAKNLIVGKAEDDDRPQIDALFEAIGVVPTYVAEIGEYFVAGAMASSGIAATLIPKLAVPPGYEITSKRISQDLHRNVFIAVRDEPRSLILQAFCEIVFNTVQSMSKVSSAASSTNR